MLKPSKKKKEEEQKKNMGPSSESQQHQRPPPATIECVLQPLPLAFATARGGRCIEHEFKNGDRYEGGCSSSGKMSGQGEYLWKNGSLLSCCFREGEAHGQGHFKLKRSDGDVVEYDGEFRCNAFNGQGRLKTNDIIFSGTFRDGQATEGKVTLCNDIGTRENKKNISSSPKNKKKQVTKTYDSSDASRLKKSLH